ncbi:MAG: AarF/UbiB family protein [Bacteroidota bacterium]|nr:AarF/UbiB family protein [Bacteroidota bacterium]
MKPGDIIKSANNKHYTIIRDVAAGDRPNANVYLCEDENQKKHIAKYFYKQRPMPNIAYGKKNHFGRRRDGSRLVFDEIRRMSKKNDFIIDHVERIKHNGKWVIILQYIDGITLTEFVKKHKSDNEIVYKAIIAFAKTLSKWHKNGFAHGDPHLDNCIVETTTTGELMVSLIDYSQIHHEDFHYCKQYDCFKTNRERRLIEDLVNNTSHFGRGFKTEIFALQKEIGYSNSLAELFDKYYVT